MSEYLVVPNLYFIWQYRLSVTAAILPLVWDTLIRWANRQEMANDNCQIKISNLY